MMKGKFAKLMKWISAEAFSNSILSHSQFDLEIKYFRFELLNLIDESTEEAVAGNDRFCAFVTPNLFRITFCFHENLSCRRMLTFGIDLCHSLKYTLENRTFVVNSIWRRIIWPFHFDWKWQHWTHLEKNRREKWKVSDIASYFNFWFH